jgi:hypothetical protein
MYPPSSGVAPGVVAEGAVIAEGMSTLVVVSAALVDCVVAVTAVSGIGIVVGVGVLVVTAVDAALRDAVREVSTAELTSPFPPPELRPSTNAPKRPVTAAIAVTGIRQRLGDAAFSGVVALGGGGGSSDTATWSQMLGGVCVHILNVHRGRERSNLVLLLGGEAVPALRPAYCHPIRTRFDVHTRGASVSRRPFIAREVVELVR